MVKNKVKSMKDVTSDNNEEIMKGEFFKSDIMVQGSDSIIKYIVVFIKSRIFDITVSNVQIGQMKNVSKHSVGYINVINHKSFFYNSSKQETCKEYDEKHRTDKKSESTYEKFKYFI